MKADQIIKCFRELSKSQGFYGRLLAQIEEEPIAGKKFLKELEEQNFKDEVDLILYLES